MSSTTTIPAGAQRAERHERMMAWACANAVMAYAGHAEILFGEWRDAVDGHTAPFDPVEVAKRIMVRRKMAAAAE